MEDTRHRDEARPLQSLRPAVLIQDARREFESFRVSHLAPHRQAGERESDCSGTREVHRLDRYSCLPRQECDSTQNDVCALRLGKDWKRLVLRPQTASHDRRGRTNSLVLVHTGEYRRPFPIHAAQQVPLRCLRCGRGLPLGETCTRVLPRRYPYPLTKPRANMKKMATAAQNALYDSRAYIESVFRNLKMFDGFVSSLPRSVNGYFANYFYALASRVLA